MRFVHVLGIVALASLFGSAADARAQAARRGAYYSRTTTARGHAGMAVERGLGSLERTSARSAANADLLRRYSSRATAAYSSAPPVARPAPPSSPRPVVRNYYPTARFGQSVNRNVGGRHCTPSRAGAIGR